MSYAGPARVAWLTLRRPDGQLDYTTVAAGANDEFDEPWCADGREIDDPSSVRVIFDPAAVRRDIAAKRAILNNYITCATADRLPDFDYTALNAFQDGLQWALEEVAAVWSDHPDYRPERDWA